MTFYRPQRGSLVDSLAEQVEVTSLRDIAVHLGVRPHTLALKPYGYDDRIDWDTYLVTVSGEGVGFTNGPLA